MSENEKNVMHQEENYEKDKASYDVADYYDMPAWYRKSFVWLWPMLCIWLFITLVSAPEYKMVSSIGYLAVVVGFQILAWLMQAHWPITRK